MRACIFNIQKFSLHDGPGIRTTVFFKGCLLRCAWCANPESLTTEKQVLWSAASCIACGACAGACPASAISIHNGMLVIDHDACLACSECVDICPATAMSLSGDDYSIEEVLAECLKDRDFYQDSGGGVTLSGGEVTMQHAFAAELLRELKTEGIHTALETNGFARAEAFQAVAAGADLLLFDLKQYDEAKHREGTGVSNAVIPDNLRWAMGAGKEILLRIPVIRGFNDSLDDARGFAALLNRFGIARVQLLPFHQMGQNKYAMLGMAYTLADVAPLHKEDLGDFAEVMRMTGVAEIIV